MRGEHFYGHLTVRKRAQVRGRPAERRGIETTGRILKLLVGQGCGFIRLESDEVVFFHRSDVQAGISINDLAVGDAVTFDLLGDHISGPRAIRVRRSQEP